MTIGNRLRVLLAIASVMVVAQVINLLTANSLVHHGLVPRVVSGLPGILWSPFLHASVRHLLSNLLPFLILSGLVAHEGLRRYLSVVSLVVLLGGLMVWVVGRPAIHIGASGLVFGLWAYLLGRCWYQRSLVSCVFALVALLGYSGLVMGFIPQAGVSFESHACGALAGIAAAWIMHSKQSPKATI